MGKFARFGLAAIMAGGVLASAPHAFAKGGITTEGSCSGASTWKPTLSIDNGRVQSEFEVDENVVGDTWKVKMTDNGVVFFTGQAITQGPSGSFEIRKFTANQDGVDKILALAKNISTGETCKGKGSI
jgi:hypothetical protein